METAQAGPEQRDPVVAPVSPPPAAEVRRVIAQALAEDIGPGDLTGTAIVDPTRRAAGRIVTRREGVLSGLEVAASVLRHLDPGAAVRVEAQEGTRVAGDETLIEIEGLARAIVAGERTTLNLLGRLSGVATLTRRYVDAVDGTGTVILDTRKTTPGLRGLEKYAVRCGGGTNHRLGLFDAILVKDNHVAIVGSLYEAVRRAVEGAPPGIRVEVEVETLEEAAVALDAGARHLLLDNMSAVTMADVVRVNAGEAYLEASGGITLANVRDIAETGVDAVSSGALTHSAPALDVSLEVVG